MPLSLSVETDRHGVRGTDHYDAEYSRHHEEVLVYLSGFGGGPESPDFGILPEATEWAGLAMAVFGVLTERLVIRPILGQPAFSIVMLTFGIGYVARGLITMVPVWP